MSELKAPSPSGGRKLSSGNILLVILGVLLVAFLILGSLNQSNTTNEFAFGAARQPFTTLALLAFLGGLLSFASPCTLPVLTAYFAFAFASDRQRIATNTLAFMLGLATTFSLFGAAGFALGRVLLQNQQVIMLVGGAAIILFGVMSLLGRGFTGATSLTASNVPDPGVKGSYLFGMTFAVGWSSCVGPILGTMLTLAAQTTSVWNGMMLLFIYTLGLGLPLLIVSTFFGRMSRDSFFWRALRGKGWDWDTSVFVVAAIWALAIWRIVVAFLEYSFENFGLFGGLEFSPALEWGILVALLIGAALFVLTSSEERRTTIHLHTTQLLSGALFILLGLLMLEGQMGLINGALVRWSAVVDEQTIRLQELLLGRFSQ
jgi:cytochrome c-type biogenesis protein